MGNGKAMERADICTFCECFVCSFGAFNCQIREIGHNCIYLGIDSLDLSKMTSGWGKPQVDIGVEGYPMAIGGREFDRGVGTHAPSVMYVDLAGGSKRFTAAVGVDDEPLPGIPPFESRVGVRLHEASNENEDIGITISYSVYTSIWAFV